MRTRLVVLVALLIGCNNGDPCAKYDTGICQKQDGCSIFIGTEMDNPNGTWCLPPSAVTKNLVCAATPSKDCSAGTRYASPPDANGNATDECVGYTACTAPEGWVDCDPGVGLTVLECTE